MTCFMRRRTFDAIGAKRTCLAVKLRAHTMMPVQACCICGKASHSYGKKNLYYNIPMFGCLCGSSALLPRSPTRAKNLVK
jgi:hypothetical protein